jgi:2-keto-3-deoxy-L-rhamnonate aldolase RhmA
MIQNTTKAKLQAGEVVLGVFDRFRDPTLAEFVAFQGWDFVVMDGEHGTLDAEDFGNLARAIELRGATPIARVNTNESSAILKALDAGAHGVHVPWVNSAEEAERAVRWVKYGPRGIRGLAGNRSIDWRANAETTAHANQETLVVIHIETQTAVDVIDDYVEVDGIDVLFVGPTDLSHSLGIPGERDHPAMTKAIEHVAAAVAGSDKAFGIYAATPEWVHRWKERGARYFTTGVDGLYATATADYLAAARS